jgi:hypothetical protein
VRKVACCLVVLLCGCLALAQSASKFPRRALDCDEGTGVLCSEVYDPIGYNGAYTGHDEPAVLFYSNVPGSGSSQIYRLRLPKDPPAPPNQNGTGGVFNFMLHPAFWFGMAMCDDQSAPNPGGSLVGPTIPCTPASDRNIFDSTNPASSHYIGKHPGAGFMEMQFYPPGWWDSCDITQWCAALNIDSLSENMNTGAVNNAACGPLEYVNFAFIQKDGIPFPPGSPSPLGPLVSTNDQTLFMNSGDELEVIMEDTAHGLKVTVRDLTTHQSGFMVSSAANGFAEVLFDPNGTTCDFATHNIPYDFHPMYATSSEHTRVPWAAHAFSVGFSDEVGHFEYCNAVDAQGGHCTQASIHDPAGPDVDDRGCFTADFSAANGLVAVGGCLGEDDDYDGLDYGLVWPGTLRSVAQDRRLHAQPVKFTSPLFRDREGELRNFSRVAFETDLPRTEFATNPPCQRHISNPADPNPGSGCVNPPAGTTFYPFYTTGQGGEEGCVWQLGGAFLPGTTNTFGGTSTSAYGPLLASGYPAVGGVPTFRYNNFRRVLNNNPCRRDD